MANLWSFRIERVKRTRFKKERALLPLGRFVLFKSNDRQDKKLITLYSNYKAWKEKCHRTFILVNPLSSKIHIQILQTDLHTFPYRISWENLFKDQSIFPYVMILSILLTFFLDYVLMLRGENRCWSLLRLKGLKGYSHKDSYPNLWLFCQKKKMYVRP